MPQDETPAVPLDDLIASAASFEVLRCERGDETRIYTLRPVPKGAELWRCTNIGVTLAHAIKECDLTSPDEASEMLEEVRRSLKAGGWLELP